MQRVLVTGASGFIGKHLCARLKAEGMEVTALMRYRAEGPWDSVIQIDLSQESLPTDALTGIDTIFHLAGKAHALSETRQDEAEYFNTNRSGTCRLLEAAQHAGVQRLVFFSSVKAMGEGGDGCLNEETPCAPETPYGKSKLEAEQLVLTGGYLPESVVLRLTMVYGPTTKGNLPRMVQAIDEGRFPPLPQVNNRRSMVHVDDVVTLALAAAIQPAAVGATYIITDGQPYTTREVYEGICAALHKPLPKWTLPMLLLTLLAKLGDAIGQLRGRRFMFDSDAMDKLIGSAWYSSEKIQRELGISAQHRLQDALPEIIAQLGIKPRKNP
ncbi:UDP-glucose 4-epimerase [hydrothermal vent metagenome]|uniref:UDP-glucose 4-epimerase n=1 Tax=hydrothermal vent metagenome TaxID=652676 RepID=A0A3B1B9L5_9ZZZZ